MHSAFIARQPIFNRQLEAVGCELLFRGHGWADDEQPESADRATATVVLNSLTELDFERIVGRKKAWVNVSREFVLDGLAQAIPADLSGLEISVPETFDEELVAALQALKDQGYELALDGFGPGSPAEPHLDLFKVVKLNVHDLGHDGLGEQVRRLRNTDCVVLADGIETYADRDFCVGAGCDLLQGHFFCQPAVAGTRGVSANRLALLQVVAALQQPDVQLADVEQLIARDVALSYRMLRYVNSAMVGLRTEVRSIGHALTLLGLESAKRWATLSVLASVDDKPTELALTALTRARFCELAGQESQLGDAAELFTLGLFSVLDALTDTSMREAAELLPLADEVRDALVDRAGPMGELLETVTARERGDRHASASVPHADELYLAAVLWADDAAESLLGATSSATPVSAVLQTPIPVPAPEVVAGAERGVIGRWLAALGRLFGRTA